MDGILMVVILEFTLWIIWALFVIVGGMAERCGQDRVLWQIVALLINPFGAMILLWIFVRVKDEKSHQC